jgi:anti-sigma B factor antagonist
VPFLTLVREVHVSRTILSVSGELDVATVGILRDEVRDVLTEAPGQVVLDLTGTTFIDSTGSRELARAAKAGAAVAVPVIAVVPIENRRVRRVLDLLQYGDLLPLHDAMPPQ